MKKLEVKENEKIGLIADIHGNGTFLVGVLNELIASGVNRFFILGDIFTEFQENQKILNALKLLEEKYEVTYIKGNREIDLIEKRKGNRDHFSHQNTGLPILYSYNHLTEENLNWIESFEDEFIVEFPNGKKALVVHFSKLNDKQKEIVAKENISIIISGHTHRVYNQEVNGIWYINPGAVGLNEDSVSYGGTYGTLDATKDEIKFTPQAYYANEKEINEVYKSLSNEKLDSTFLGMTLDLSMKTGRNMTAVFFKEVQRLSGLYRDNKEERTQTGFYQPQSLESSLSFGYIDEDINDIPKPYDKRFASIGGNVKFDKDIISMNCKIPSNMRLLNEPTARQEIFRTALNNLIYYGTIIEINSLGESVVVENLQINYEHKRR